MIRLEIDQNQMDILYENFLKQPHHKTRLKNLVLYLKSKGYKHSVICELCRISKPTLIGYLREYEEFGIESFEKTNWKGQKSKLDDYKDIIDKDFEANPPRSTNEARDRIEQLTGLVRSPTQVQVFIKKLNYRYLKLGSIPGNGDGEDEKREEQREEFKKKSLNHAWQRLKEGRE